MNVGSRYSSRFRRLLSFLATWRYLPHLLAVVAFLIMVPALFGGLFGDDLIQRLAQLKPEQMPGRVFETGLVTKRCGTFSGVVNDLFGYMKTEEQRRLAMDYFAPWWASPDWQAALWRPLTAFTHWMDYRLYPNTPWLMHLVNNVWFAGVVFMVAVVYRRIAGDFGDGGETIAMDGEVRASSRRLLRGEYIAAMAAVLFLIDKNTYFPMMYVANRGFFIALFFGLVSLYAHHRWRVTKRGGWCLASVFSLFLAMLANEAGVSTMAFLMGYALILEQSGARGATRPTFFASARTLIPVVGAVVMWRVIYVGQHCGVKNFSGYIDPGYSPGLFLKNLLQRMSGLLGGQLSGVMPEITFGTSPGWKLAVAMFFAAFIVICAIVFYPIVRRDLVARFWLVVMILAAVPAATVLPISKNLGFVAMGAFGVIAAFLMSFLQRDERFLLWKSRRGISWCVAGWLLFVHVPGSLLTRAGLAVITPALQRAMDWGFYNLPEAGNRDVVVINDPGPAYMMEAIYRANCGGVLPKSVKGLTMGLMGLDISRPDERTLVATTKSGDFFSTPVFGPVHAAYAVKSGNDFLFGGLKWKKGDKVVRKGWTVEVLEVTREGEPTSAAYHFNSSLESTNWLWLRFGWGKEFGYQRFVLPEVGEMVEVDGPKGQ